MSENILLTIHQRPFESPWSSLHQSGQCTPQTSRAATSSLVTTWPKFGWLNWQSSSWKSRCLLWSCRPLETYLLQNRHSWAWELSSLHVDSGKSILGHPCPWFPSSCKRTKELWAFVRSNHRLIGQREYSGSFRDYAPTERICLCHWGRFVRFRRRRGRLTFYLRATAMTAWTLRACVCFKFEGALQTYWCRLLFRAGPVRL